ncbi:hypothetical protein [Streptomyces sp. WZ-12]|uniref:hypothetical protein n=1 Tax=Streptomyces sp. WZ-12 TaxID=3030210 RepID=UPI002380CF8F|nr:hypothetical protein [Streptomyces sp. WZ-12]
MPSHYPQAVRRWPKHANQLDYVMAEDVNEIQDEIQGISTTLGVMPNEYQDSKGTTTRYTSVDSRLDNIQRDIEKLRFYQDQLLDASKTGWNLPVSAYRASGTPIPATVNQVNPNTPNSDWYPVKWDQAVVDPLELAPKPTYWLTCPKTGWWIVTARAFMWRSYGPATLEHSMFCEINLLGDGSILGSDGDSINRQSPGYLRTNPSYSGPWYQGEKIGVRIRHMDSMRVNNRPSYPDPVGTQTAYAWLGLTYIRALPGQGDKRPDWDVDPIGI